MPTPALHLTTSLPGDFVHHSANGPETVLSKRISPTRRAWLVLNRSIWLHMYSHCPQMTSNNGPRVPGGHREPPQSQASLTMAKSSP